MITEQSSSTAMDDPSYNDSHRAFLQTLQARPSITFEEAQPILAAIFSIREQKEVLPNDVTEEDFTSYITACNAAISPFDYEIRRTLHQTTREPIYALVNTTSDPLTQLATTYNADEIAYVKRVLDWIFITKNRKKVESLCISSADALNRNKPEGGSQRRQSGAAAATQAETQSAGAPLSMTEAQDILANLVQEGWFERSDEGYYSLAPRALIELRSWLSHTYDEEGEGGVQRIKFCAACRDVVTVGQRCPDLNCLGRLHDHCTERFFRAQKARKCPVCKKDWTGEDFVGQRALGADATRGQRVSGNRGRGRPSQVVEEDVEEAEEADGDADADEDEDTDGDEE